MVLHQCGTLGTLRKLTLPWSDYKIFKNRWNIKGNFVFSYRQKISYCWRYWKTVVTIKKKTNERQWPVMTILEILANGHVWSWPVMTILEILANGHDWTWPVMTILKILANGHDWTWPVMTILKILANGHDRSCLVMTIFEIMANGHDRLWHAEKDKLMEKASIWIKNTMK